MFKLRAAEWAIAVGVFLFFGFAVFALTRDYYLRHPAGPVAEVVPQRGHGTQGGPAFSVLGAANAIPESIAGSDPELLHGEADSLFGAGRYREAIPVYRRILELRAEDPEAHNDLGLALHYTGQTGQAIEVLRRGVESSPDFQRIWLSLGFVSLQGGDPEEARGALTRARDLGADNQVGREAARLLGTIP